MELQPSTRSGLLVPLGVPIFRAVWIATLASNFGGLIQAVGAAWMMASITTSESMVALVQASTTLPIMLFSLASGALADNFSRRHVMLVAQAFMLVVSLLLTAFAWLGWLSPWLLLGFTFLIGCGTALNNPSWQASVGDMVPRDHLPSAVALNSVGFNLTRSVAPAAGGLIVAAGGAVAAFAVNSLSYLGLMAVLWRWAPPPLAQTLPRERLGEAMGAGLRYIFMSPNLMKVLLRSFLFGLTTIAVLALLPLVARDVIAGGPLLYGALLGAFGAGAVGGAFLGGRLSQQLSSEGRVRIAFAGFAICAAVVGFSRNEILTLVGMLFGGASWVLGFALFNVTVQLSTPRWVVGRSLALYQTAAFGGMTLGSWLWGAVAERYDPSTALLVAAAGIVASGLVGLFLPLPDRAALNLDPANRFQEPAVAIDITPRSGPIQIEVEYRIAEADVPAFLAAMQARHRIRVRDGARHWHLVRDLHDAMLWLETYQTPTWVEYLRHNSRRTQVDSENTDLLRELHRGPGLPEVRRRIVRQTRWTGDRPVPRPPIDHP